MVALVEEASSRLSGYRAMQGLKASAEGPQLGQSALADAPEVSSRGFTAAAIKNAGKGIGTVNGSPDVKPGGGDDFANFDVGSSERAPSKPAWEQVGGVAVAAPVVGGMAGTLNAHAKEFGEDGPAAGPNPYRTVELDASHHDQAEGINMMTGLGEQSERTTLATAPKTASEGQNAGRVAAETRLAESMGVQTPGDDAINPSSLMDKIRERRAMDQPYGAPAVDIPAPDAPQPVQERRMAM